MHKRATHALLLLSLATTAGCAASRGTTSDGSPPQTLGSQARVHCFTPQDRQAVERVLRDQESAWNRGDIDAFMEGYKNSPDLVFTSGAKVRRGYAETRARYRARYGNSPATMGRLGFEVLGVQALGADGAVVLGRWKLVFAEEEGREKVPSTLGGIFSVVLERGTEGWRIVHDHTSSDPQ